MFTKYVQVGRVAFVGHGPEKGKLGVIVDIIDQNKVLLDGPCTGVVRQPYLMKYLHLTKFMVNMPYGCGNGHLKKLWEKQGLSESWEKTGWAIRVKKRELRTQLTDFDRFRLYKAKQRRNRIVKEKFYVLRKAARKTNFFKPKKRKHAKNRKAKAAKEAAAK